MTPSITTFGIETLGIQGLTAIFSMFDIQHEHVLLKPCQVSHYYIAYDECRYTECRYAECRGTPKYGSFYFLAKYFFANFFDDKQAKDSLEHYYSFQNYNRSSITKHYGFLQNGFDCKLACLSTHQWKWPAKIKKSLAFFEICPFCANCKSIIFKMLELDVLNRIIKLDM